MLLESKPHSCFIRASHGLFWLVSRAPVPSGCRSASAQQFRLSFWARGLLAVCKAVCIENYSPVMLVESTGPVRFVRLRIEARIAELSAGKRVVGCPVSVSYSTAVAPGLDLSSFVYRSSSMVWAFQLWVPLLASTMRTLPVLPEHLSCSFAP